MTSRNKIMVILSLLSLISSATPQIRTTSLTITTTTTGRTYEGIGALSAGASSRLLPDYTAPIRSSILDYLFKPMYGASLDHLKVEIGGDINSTCGVEPSFEHQRDHYDYTNGYEWWLMKEAKKRNPAIKLDALEWGAPYWIGKGNFYSTDNINYVASFIQKAKEQYQLDIDYMGIWNETAFDTNYIKQLSKKLKQSKLNTKIVAADEVCSWNIADSMTTDPQLMASVDIIGTHYPPHGSSSVAQNSGKSLWASEEGATMRNWWQAACYLIKKFNRGYIDGKIVKHVIWSLAGAYYDILPVPESGLLNARTPWCGDFQIKPALWSVAHYTQFAHPGWIFCESASTYLDSLKDASIVALFNPKTCDYSIIIETVDSRKDKPVCIHIAPEMKNCLALHVWQSTKDSCFIQKDDVDINNGIVYFIARKGSIYSITSTTGQHRGGIAYDTVNEENSSDCRFPLPYQDNFDSYGCGQMPKYLSDQSGLFLTATVDGRKVLQQSIQKRGIEWLYHVNPMPYTIIGDTAWTDYSIEADVRTGLAHSRHATIYGRINSIYQHTVTEPNSYWFRIYSNGTWMMGKTVPSILNGHVNMKDGWKQYVHQLMEKEGKTVRPLDDTQKSLIIPYRELTSIHDSQIRTDLKPVYELLDNKSDAEETFLELLSFGMYDVRMNTPLAKGKWNSDKGWHHIKMTFKGNTIIIWLDGKKLVNVTDFSFTHGMCGLGCDFGRTLFDNLKIY